MSAKRKEEKTLEKRNFEESVADLEKVVRELEGGTLSLDDSLRAFERGILLARECEKHLTAAKGRIEQVLVNEKGEWKTSDL